MKKLLTCLFVVAVAVIFMAAPAAAEWSTSDSNNLSTVKSDVSSIKTSNSNILTQLQNIYTCLGTVGGYVDTVETKLQTLIDSVSKIIGYIDGVESSLTAIQKAIENIDGNDSNIAILFGNGWASTGGTSANNRTTWYGYMLSNLSNIYVRLSSTNTYLEHLETSSDSILHSLNTLSLKLSNSILYGNGDDGGSFGLIDLLSSTGSVKSNVYSVFDSLAYQDDGGNWHSYVQEMWTTLDMIPGVLQTINTNVYNAGKTIHDDLGLIYERQRNILVQLGNIEMLSVRIRQLIDGTGSEGTGLLPETIGIHSDTTSIDKTTTNIEALTRLFTQTFVDDKYYVDDFDARNIAIELPSGASSNNRNQFVVYRPASGIHYAYMYFPSWPDNSTYGQNVAFSISNSPVFPAGSYRVSGAYFAAKGVSSGKSLTPSTAWTTPTQSNIVSYDEDFIITSVVAYFPVGFDFSSLSSRRWNVYFYGPLEVQGTNGLLELMADKLSMLQYSLADRDQINTKLKNDSVIDSANQNFFSGSDSTTSLGTKGLGNVKSIGDSVGSKLDSGVSAGQLGTALDGALSNDGGLGWFSSDTASDLDTVAAPALEFDPDPIVTDYYNDYQSQVQAWLSLHGGDDG